MLYLHQNKSKSAETSPIDVTLQKESIQICFDIPLASAARGPSAFTRFSGCSKELRGRRGGPREAKEARAHGRLRSSAARRSRAADRSRPGCCQSVCTGSTYRRLRLPLAPYASVTRTRRQPADGVRGRSGCGCVLREAHTSLLALHRLMRLGNSGIAIYVT